MRSVSIIAAAISAFASPVLAQVLAQPQLTLTTTYTLPNATFDLRPDGTLLGITPDGVVLQQDEINGSTFFASGTTIGQVNAGGFAPSFLAISPDGASVAVGNNEFNASNAVTIYPASELTGIGIPTPTATINTPNFKADWADNSTLFVSGADSSTFNPIINRIDTTTASAETVISPAGVFSGGVHAEGDTLLVGDGNSGDIRAFDLASLAAPAVGFNTGDLVTSSTSASDIDTLGDLLLIAGQTFGGEGSAFVIDRAAGTSITLQPAGPDAFYGGYFNHITNQLVVTAGDTAYVYAIPAPATLALAPLALVATRRRRA